jgi:hypothetical protein
VVLTTPPYLMGRSPDELRLWFRPKVSAFCAQAEAVGYPLRVVRTGTSDLVQGALYAIGRRELTLEEKEALLADGLYPDSFEHTRTKAAHAADTPHGCGLAFDVVVLQQDGKVWKQPPVVVWQALYKVAERCGLDALGDPWGEFVSWDPGHFQEPGWRLYRGSAT